MILTLDIGNTNMKTALFDGDEIYNPWDVSKFVASAVEAGNKAALRGTKELSPNNL